MEWPTDGDQQRTVAAVIASRGLDGSDWPGRGAPQGHLSGRQPVSPRGAFCDLGKLFFELAGSPLAEVRIY